MTGGAPGSDREQSGPLPGAGLPAGWKERAAELLARVDLGMPRSAVHLLDVDDLPERCPLRLQTGSCGGMAVGVRSMILNGIDRRLGEAWTGPAYGLLLTEQAPAWEDAILHEACHLAEFGLPEAPTEPVAATTRPAAELAAEWAAAAPKFRGRMIFGGGDAHGLLFATAVAHVAHRSGRPFADVFSYGAKNIDSIGGFVAAMEARCKNWRHMPLVDAVRAMPPQGAARDAWAAVEREWNARGEQLLDDPDVLEWLATGKFPETGSAAAA